MTIPGQGSSIFRECLKGLSKKSKSDLLTLRQLIVDNFRIKREEYMLAHPEYPGRPTLGYKGAEEIIVALIKDGKLPLGENKEMTELERRMSQWGLP